ncbi:MAG: hypothetical protein M1457_08040 [bacterium]|nr:hypothetical protein [bacterium]
MALVIEISLEQNRLNVQESTPVTIKLHNPGSQPINIANTARQVLQPVFFARNSQTGEKLAFRRPWFAGVASAAPDQLAAGEKFTWEAPLTVMAPIEAPGDYELTAEYQWDNGAKTARSTPVALTLLPVQVRSLIMGMSRQPDFAIFYLFWTQQVNGDCRLMRTMVYNHDVPTITETRFVESVPPGTEPQVSTTAIGGNPLRTWVAWLNGRILQCRFVGDDAANEAVISEELPDVKAHILDGPVMLDTLAGEIPLWLAAPASSRSKFQLAVIGRGGLRPAGDLLLPEDEPAWSRTVLLSNRQRRLYFAVNQENETILQQTGWGDDSEFTPVKELARHPGRVIGGGLSLLQQEIVTGVLVIQSGNSAGTLELLPWHHAPNQNFLLGEPESVVFNQAAMIDEVLVRINTNMEAFVVVRAVRQWHYRQPGGPFAPLGGAAGVTKGPLAMFFNALQQPLFVYTKPGQGFYFCDPAGIPPQTLNP